MAYKMPDYPAYTVKENNKTEKTKNEKKDGSANMGFEENWEENAVICHRFLVVHTVNGHSFTVIESKVKKGGGGGILC